MRAALSDTFNKEVGGNEAAEFLLDGAAYWGDTLLQMTPTLDGGTLVRRYVFNTQANKSWVDAYYRRDEASKYLGSKIMSEMDSGTVKKARQQLVLLGGIPCSF